MIFYNITQNSDEWFELRKGKFTASTFKDLFMKESTDTYKKAVYRVAFEKLTGETPEESYTNGAMLRGKELESEARHWYEKKHATFIDNGGFCELSEWIGASPDGFIEDKGILEIKCPLYNTQIDYLLKNQLPTQYKWQVHGQLYVTNTDYCDFLSYHPKLKPMLIRVHRDEKIETELKEKLDESIEKAKQIMEKLNAITQ